MEKMCLDARVFGQMHLRGVLCLRSFRDKVQYDRDKDFKFFRKQREGRQAKWEATNQLRYLLNEQVLWCGCGCVVSGKKPQPHDFESM